MPDHWIGGIHSVRTALADGGRGLEEIWMEPRREDRRLRELLDLARAAGIPVRQAQPRELDRRMPGINHQGVGARSQLPTAGTEADLAQILGALAESAFLLVLDGVQDPHNLGACLRTCDAAGVQALIVPKDNAVGLTPVVCKVASGAAGRVPFVQVTNLARTLRWLKDQGVWLIGTDDEAAASLFHADLTGPLALVMGGEERGLRRLTRECCDGLASLPMRGRVESLNVAVATGIALYEALRQRSL
jgi:23S rRNA (guanosine2251-2'-O)-methyltransferase